MDRRGSDDGFRAGRFGIGCHGRHLGATDVVVEGKVFDGEVLQGSGGGVTWPVGRNLDVANVGIVGVLRPEAEIPHHLGRDLRIVGVEQGKGRPATQLDNSPRSLRFTCAECFSVAALWGGGH